MTTASTLTQSWWQRIMVIFPNANIALGLIALTVYGLIRVGYDSFYGQLDLRAEDVGITYVSVITRAAVAALTLAIAALLIPVGLWPYIRNWPKASIGLALIGVAELALGGMFNVIAATQFGQHIGNGEGPLTTNATSVMIVGVGEFAMALVNRVLSTRSASSIIERGDPWIETKATHRLRLQMPQLFRRSRITTPLTEILVMALGVWFTLTLFDSYGTAAAQQVQAGKSLGSDVFGALFDFRADRVCAMWTGQNQPASLDLREPLLRMGQADGTLVLYRPAQHSSVASPARTSGPIRLPSANVITIPAQESQSNC